MSPGPLSTYTRLKDDFLQRLAAANIAGGYPDPRQAQIARLQEQVRQLRTRLATQAEEITALQRLQTMAVSRLAVQHQELERLRVRQIRDRNVIPLR